MSLNIGEGVSRDPFETPVHPLDLSLVVGDNHHVIGCTRHQRELPGLELTPLQHQLGFPPFREFIQRANPAAVVPLRMGEKPPFTPGPIADTNLSGATGDEGPEHLLPVCRVMQ